MDVGDANSNVGHTEAVTVGAVSGLGWSGRMQPDGEITDDQDLTAEGQKDPKVSLAIRIAEDRLRLEVVLIELRRLFGLGRVDVDVIE
jgi:hypothetical protein